MIYVTGRESIIIRKLEEIFIEKKQNIQIKRIPGNYSKLKEPLDKQGFTYSDKFIFCAGILYSKNIFDQSKNEIIKSLSINLINTIIACDIILTSNHNARIIIIGSESANYGSYDMTYACAKAGIECYVKTKKLKPNQQLLCISTHIIIDAGMTTRRKDLKTVYRRAEKHPKLRWITAMEVAKTIYHYLYVDEGYTTGQIIRMNGGLR